MEKAEQNVVDTATFELMLCVAVASANVNPIGKAIQLMSDLEATINGEDAARHTMRCDDQSKDLQSEIKTGRRARRASKDEG